MTPGILYAIGRTEGNVTDVALSRALAEERAASLKAEHGGFWHLWAIRIDLDQLDDVLDDVESVSGPMGEVYEFVTAGEVAFERKASE